MLVCGRRRVQTGSPRDVMFSEKCESNNGTATALTWGVASSCASGPPSSAASHVDGASAPRPQAPVCGAAGPGGLRAGAAPAGHLYWRGGG